jgi:hypothetical protein
MRTQRRKHVHTNGLEEEYIFISPDSLKSPGEVEQLGCELLQAAQEWRAEIEARGPPGPPAFKTFDFIRYNGNGRIEVASWIKHPWALIRHGAGTAVAFLVKKESRGFKAWIVSVKYESCEHKWKCRFEYSSAVDACDLIATFPYTLPDSPTLGDVERARNEARSAAA